jgi:hypothetical protein
MYPRPMKIKWKDVFRTFKISEKCHMPVNGVLQTCQKFNSKYNSFGRSKNISRGAQIRTSHNCFSHGYGKFPQK